MLQESKYLVVSQFCGTAYDNEPRSYEEAEKLKDKLNAEAVKNNLDIFFIVIEDESTYFSV